MVVQWCCWPHPEVSLPPTMTPVIYHEKQIKELCALHALNNLFQDGGAFGKQELDQLCRALSPDHWINPHRSMLGLGNYDINVIMAALLTKGCGVVWFDKRKDPQVIALHKVVGFILNVPSECRLGPFQLPLRRKHWVAIRSIRGIYYNLDSKLDGPEVIGKEQELIEYLREELRQKDMELFVVVTQAVEGDRSWCLPLAKTTAIQPINGQDPRLAQGSHVAIANPDTAGEPQMNDDFGGDSCVTEGFRSHDGRPGHPFNPPGLSYIDQDGSDGWEVAQPTRASQETL